MKNTLSLSNEDRQALVKAFEATVRTTSSKDKLEDMDVSLIFLLAIAQSGP